MDREQEEMQFLGFFGIYKESYKVIIACRKIFSKITLSLILPLSFIYLVHMEVSSLLFRKIIHTKVELDEAQSPAKAQKLHDLISNEMAYFWLFKAAYFTLFLIFSLLSTSAVVYTIACIYTARELTFGKVMSVVPKVWKRLMVTFLCTFLTMFVYHVMAIFIMVSSVILLLGSDAVDAVLAVLLVLYFVGFLYMTIIWHLASVISVLEECYGFQAMLKGKNLIKGKLWVAIIIFLKLIISLVIIQAAFQSLVVHGSSLGIAMRVVYAIICFLLLSKLILFVLVIQTVIYFVCKSYHHENIDKSALSDHLEVYLGEYVPLKAKDVQLEQFQV
ncbi:hypothetical protein ERO13_D02G074800v2 [Gossypium hirsutum]|uniref:Uncharacterized protein n=5 Tax=Gossypium TaxID=3633 RepID=A0A1U8JYA3_GOSHI|nr:uncharacterized protein LOC107910411 [Gossypium hirsutum]KAB2040480.1 hypothetical protein ES319_D02G086100v1 [Gossypium barbadense]TYG78829.1 hypothetical protein ES288_D02G092200v1 [Gossypium darwinii]TYH82941.1 hypothetical protein ES332_D02G096900v1 [Gossypium tomentosum]TYI92734.1 hypothetical protein E1A91_D02G091300v1 [Gossypium mustelinum]KAG4157632.1 hypothetical protein ERO13_D02G074800v2 [Gossypium hirsutum]